MAGTIAILGTAFRRQLGFNGGKMAEAGWSPKPLQVWKGEERRGRVRRESDRVAIAAAEGVRHGQRVETSLEWVKIAIGAVLVLVAFVIMQSEISQYEQNLNSQLSSMMQWRSTMAAEHEIVKTQQTRIVDHLDRLDQELARFEEIEIKRRK